MAPHLSQAGYDVVGLDTGYFRQCTFVPDEAEMPVVRKDIRDLEPSDLEGFRRRRSSGGLEQRPDRQSGCRLDR